MKQKIAGLIGDRDLLLELYIGGSLNGGEGKARLHKIIWMIWWMVEKGQERLRE